MLEEKILNDYKQAMKAKDTLKSSVLSYLRAEIINVAIAKKKKTLEDNDCLTVIKKQIKQHQDSIVQFKQGNRNDLADKEAKEMEILKLYLPPQLSEDQLKKLIEEIISSTGAQGLKDMGKVMKEAAVRVGQSADSKLLSELVRERLSKSP